MTPANLLYGRTLQPRVEGCEMRADVAAPFLVAACFCCYFGEEHKQFVLSFEIPYPCQLEPLLKYIFSHLAAVHVFHAPLVIFPDLI